LTLVERLHRRLLDVIRTNSTPRPRDINSVQALLLYNIGDKELTAGELRTRGYYLGSNVSYTSRSWSSSASSIISVRASIAARSYPPHAQGQEIRRIVDALYQKHVKDRGAGRRHLDEEICDLEQVAAFGWSGSGPTRSCIGALRHDPENGLPVFRTDHA